MVDSGKNGHGARIKSVMDMAGVSRIDFFVNTHYHEDHYGGVDENDKSVALLIEFEDFRYFVGGDIELTTEGKIAQRASRALVTLRRVSR